MRKFLPVFFYLCKYPWFNQSPSENKVENVSPVNSKGLLAICYNIVILPFSLPRSLSISLHCLSYNSHDVSLENLVLDQLIIL